MDARMTVPRRPGQAADGGMALPVTASRSRSSAPRLRPSRVPVTAPEAARQAGPGPAPAGRVRRPSEVPAGTARVLVRPAAGTALDVVRGSGQPLAVPVRQEMEGRLGADFSDVRVHTGAAARASAAALGARAYTLGSHVVLGEESADKHTLAHELTHVIQQRRGPVAGISRGGGLKVSEPSDRDERAAAAHAAWAMGHPPREPAAARPASEPPAGRHARPEVVQRAARVLFAGRNYPVRVGSLSEPDLQRVIALLEQNPAVANGVIQTKDIRIDLDGTAPQTVLDEAKNALAAIKPKTKNFNVRGRSQALPETVVINNQETPSAFVFTDNAGIREIAAKNGLPSYPMGSLDEVKAAYPALRQQGEPLIRQDYVEVYVVARPGLRGPRADAAQPPGGALKVAPPTKNPWTQALPLNGPSAGSPDHPTRDSAMGNISALNYARAVGFPGADQHSWEWLHLIARSLGGKNEKDNLVAGTYDANTLMIPLESTIAKYSEEKGDELKRKPATITSEAVLWENPRGELTWVARSITLALKRGAQTLFWLGPIEMEAQVLTRIEYDIYRHVFRAIAGLAAPHQMDTTGGGSDTDEDFPPEEAMEEDVDDSSGEE